MKAQSGYEQSAPYYDLFDTKDNIEFFAHYAEEVGEVLDVGAGTGRISIPLARRGVQVTSVEPSRAMRRQFFQKLKEEPDLCSQIALIAGNAQSFQLDRSFPCAILSGTFDHLLNDEDRREALGNINRHLQPGGRLIFVVFLGLMDDQPLSPAGTVSIPGGEVRRLVGGKRVSPPVKEILLVYEVYHKGEMVERVEERSRVGITDRNQIHQVLQETGCTVREEWSDYHFTPYQEGDSLLIITAQKVRSRG